MPVVLHDIQRFRRHVHFRCYRDKTLSASMHLRQLATELNKSCPKFSIDERHVNNLDGLPAVFSDSSEDESDEDAILGDSSQQTGLIIKASINADRYRLFNSKLREKTIFTALQELHEEMHIPRPSMALMEMEKNHKQQMEKSLEEKN